jgi:hypothetical protein
MELTTGGAKFLTSVPLVMDNKLRTEGWERVAFDDAPVEGDGTMDDRAGITVRWGTKEIFEEGGTFEEVERMLGRMEMEEGRRDEEVDLIPNATVGKTLLGMKKRSGKLLAKIGKRSDVRVPRKGVFYKWGVSVSVFAHARSLSSDQLPSPLGYDSVWAG